MRLRGKILIVLSITLALLVFGLYTLATATVMKGFVELESDSMRTDVRRVRDALARDINVLAEKTGDWAYWDDLYNFIEKPDERFVTSTVSDAALNSMRVDALIVVDTTGKSLAARGFDRQKQVSIAPSPAFVEAFKPGTVLNPFPGKAQLTPAPPPGQRPPDRERLIVLDPPTCPDATCAGIVEIEGRFYLVATRPILRSDQSGPTRGRIAFFRAFDQASLDELAARTHLKIDVTPMSKAAQVAGNEPSPASTAAGIAPNPADATILTLPEKTPEPQRWRTLRTAPDGTLLVTVLDAKTIVGEAIVHDLHNQPAFVLRVEAFRHIVTRGRQTLDFLALFIIASGLAFGLVTYLAIDRLVLSRILRLSGDVQSIGQSGTTSGRVQSGGDDEVAWLADAINNALVAIDSSQQLIRQREAESRKLALVAARTDNTVVITDPLGRIEWVNEGFTRLTGYTLPEVVGKKPGSVLQGPDTDPATAAHMSEQLRQGRGFHSQLLNYKKNGNSYWVDVEVQPIYDAAGTLVNFMAIESDITESRQLTQALRDARDAAEAASRAKSQFLANMSHEIRTPMTAILGFAELLNDPQTSLSQRDNYSHSIVRNGHHLLSIINDILDLSKIEAEKMTIEQVSASVPQLVAEVMGTMNQLAAEKKLALVVRYESPIPASITSDPYRLRQILTNLVSNAVKFTQQGIVTVRVAMLDDFGSESPRLRFDVADTGPGISAAQQSQLFQPFTQADTSTTRRFGGTGLGLTISRRLAVLLGGELTVSSAVGKGSTFTLVVPTGSLQGVKPLADPVAEQARHSEPPRATAGAALANKKALEGATILLAEDGIDNQRLLTFILTQAGATVAVASTGQAAIDQVQAAIDQNRPPNMILMDMQMPELDGYSATRILRDRGVTITVIALTAHAMASDRDKCLAAGCDDYVTKPINRERMLNLLSDYLARIRASRK